MKLSIPGIGQIKTGKDVKPVVQRVEVPVKEKGVLLGTWLDIFTKKLSSETEVSPKLLEAYSEWVFANVSAISEEVSKLEPQLFKLVLKNGKSDLQEIDSHPILDLLDRFNESATSSEAFYVTEAHLELAGDAFYYVEGSGSNIKNLFILQPNNMEVLLGDFTDASSRLIEGYKYTVQIKDKTRTIRYEPDEIIHIKVPNPSNPYRGKSVVEAAAKTLDTDEATTESLINFFRNGMIAQFALESEQQLTEAQIKQLQAGFKRTGGNVGVRNAFNIPVFSGGLKVAQLQQSNKETELLKLEEWFRDKTMAMFKNTKTSLGITDDVNRANAEASQLAWKRNVIVPKMTRIVDALNEFLVPRYGDNLILGFKDPIPEDRASHVKDIALLVDSGVITPNEARDELEYDPTEGGDDLKGLPQALKYVNYKRVYRKQGWPTKIKREKDLYDYSKAAARELISKKKAVTKEPQKPSLRKVTNFWKRIADIIQELEDQFRPRVQNLILEVAKEAADNLDNQELRQSGEIFDREAKIARIRAELEPVLSNAVALAGQQANSLLGIHEPYIPKHIKQNSVISRVREQIDMFATSMLDTDKEVLAEIIANGLKEGSGVPLIRKAIEDKFAEFSKSQAERITRTEVAWAANRGVLDAYTQSGVVEAKQWLTAPGACEYCVPMDGKIVSLSESYFDKGAEWQGDAKTPLKLDYRNIEEPPLHPNCRCTIISVIEGIGPLIEPKTAHDVARFKEMIEQKNKIAELETKVDKRTKAYKKLKQQQLEDKEYIKKLEKLTS